MEKMRKFEDEAEKHALDLEKKKSLQSKLK